MQWSSLNYLKLSQFLICHNHEGERFSQEYEHFIKKKKYAVNE